MGGWHNEPRSWNTKRWGDLLSSHGVGGRGRASSPRPWHSGQDLNHLFSQYNLRPLTSMNSTLLLTTSFPAISHPCPVSPFSGFPHWPACSQYLLPSLASLCPLFPLKHPSSFLHVFLLRFPFPTLLSAISALGYLSSGGGGMITVVFKFQTLVTGRCEQTCWRQGQSPVWDPTVGTKEGSEGSVGPLGGSLYHEVLKRPVANRLASLGLFCNAGILNYLFSKCLSVLMSHNSAIHKKALIKNSFI